MLINVLAYPLLTLVNVVRFMIQGMGFSMFAILAGVMEMIARSLAGMFLVPALGFVGAAVGSRWHGLRRIFSSCRRISAAAAY